MTAFWLLLPLLLAFSPCHSQEEDAAALLTDDACGDDSSGACALSALQLRAGPGEVKCDETDRVCRLTLQHLRAKENGTHAGSEVDSAAIAQAKLGSYIATLYHATSPGACESILKTGFHPGSTGWCGGGIYFADNPTATKWKAIGPDSKQGCILEAKVDIGRPMLLGFRCITSPYCYSAQCLAKGNSGQWVKSKGFDSIVFNPGDGTEYVIFEGHRVVSVRKYS